MLVVIGVVLGLAVLVVGVLVFLGWLDAQLERMQQEQALRSEPYERRGQWEYVPGYRRSNGRYVRGHWRRM